MAVLLTLEIVVIGDCLPEVDKRLTLNHNLMHAVEINRCNLVPRHSRHHLHFASMNVEHHIFETRNH